MVAIPVPPFSDHDDAQRFHQLLMLHVSQLKRPGDPVGIHQFLLGQTLAMHAPTWGREVTCLDCAQPNPCRTLLRVALVSRFPVPWQLPGLAHLLSAANLWSSPSLDDVVREDAFAWNSDPRFFAERAAGGGWVVTVNERGRSQIRARPADDRQMVEFLADQVTLHSFPFGYRVDQSWPPALEAGGGEAAAWWGRHGRLPYLQSHTPDGVW